MTGNRLSSTVSVWNGARRWRRLTSVGSVGAGSHEYRSPPHLFKDDAEVLPCDSDGEELDASEDQDRAHQPRPTWDRSATRPSHNTYNVHRAPKAAVSRPRLVAKRSGTVENDRRLDQPNLIIRNRPYLDVPADRTPASYE